MFFFDPPVKKLKFGIPSRGLVSLIVPGWDVRGRNIAAVTPTPSAMTNIGLAFLETVANTTHIAKLIDIVSPCVAKCTFIPTGRIRFMFGYGITQWTICDTSTVSIVATGAGASGAAIADNGDGSFTVSCKYTGGADGVFLYAMPDTATDQSTRNFVGDITKGFTIVSYQVNLGTILYPYSAPLGLPQTLSDYSQKGNSFIRGATTAVGADDPTLSASGVTFGADDFCKSASAVFDDMAAFTAVTALNVASAGGGSAGRIWDKAQRYQYILSQKLTLDQVRSGGNDRWAGDTIISYGVNYISGLVYNPTTPDSPPSVFVNSTKQIITRPLTGSGTLTSNASSDLFIGNRSAADRNLDGTIYAQAWYNRILSDSEYRQAYKGMQRLCAAMGITV